MAYGPTHRVSCPSRSRNLVCKIPISLLGLSETNTIGYYVANDIAQTYHGMMLAIPEDEWRVFSRMRPAEMVATLRELAQKVCLKGYRKSPLGPKKPRPKREGSTKSVHAHHLT